MENRPKRRVFLIACVALLVIGTIYLLAAGGLTDMADWFIHDAYFRFGL